MEVSLADKATEREMNAEKGVEIGESASRGFIHLQICRKIEFRKTQRMMENTSKIH